MRKVILYSAASLDGFIARKDHGIDWLFSDQDYGYKEFYDSIDTTLTGNSTYTQVLGFGEFPYPGKKNFIFSRTKSGTEGEVTFINEDPAAFVKKLKEEEGENIWLVGGSQINTILLKAGLIDELVLSYHPVLLGEGIPLFDGEHQETWWHPVNTRVFQSGLIQIRFLRKTK